MISIDTPAKRRRLVTLLCIAATLILIPLLAPADPFTYALTVMMIGLIITTALLVLRYIENWIEG